MKLKINWMYEGEAGYWTSSERRFNINPDGWRSGTTPDYYVLHDSMAVATEVERKNKFDTVQEAKTAALKILEKEHRQ